jgi:hypothetical protein
MASPLEAHLEGAPSLTRDPSLGRAGANDFLNLADLFPVL